MKLKREKLANRLARQMATGILEEGWPVGRKLGTEAALLRRFKVSREPFREAVRILERQGIVKPERGSNGGLTVQAPTLAAASNMLRTYLEFQDVSFREAHQALYTFLRFGFESAIARMTPAHANALRRCAQKPSHAFRSRDQEGRALGGVYEAVIEAAGNPSLSMLTATATRLVADFGHQERYPATLWATLTQKMWPHVADMAESAARGDTKAALAALDNTFQYVQATVKSLQERNPRVWNTDSFLGGSYSSAILAQRTADKMGVALAYDLMAEVRRKRLEPGTKLGSETALVARFDVGRSTFREAARTLEFFGMATVQQGSGGGLTLIEPDPSLVVDTAVLFLQYFGSDGSNTETFADRIEDEMSRLITARATHRELLALIDEVGALAEVPPKNRKIPLMHTLRQWGRLADNRVLALANEVLAIAYSQSVKRSVAKSERDSPAGLLSVTAKELRAAASATSEQLLAGALRKTAKALRSALPA